MSYRNSPRYYEPIWQALKSLGKLEVSVEKHLARRVRKAVSKEKDIDVGFKILNELERHRLLSHYDEKRGVLCLELRASFGIPEREE